MKTYARRSGISKLSLVIFSVILLPSFLYVTLELSSLSAPLAIVSLSFLAILALRKPLTFPKSSVNSTKLYAMILQALVGIHLAIDLVLQPTFEAIATIFTLAIFVLVAYLSVPRLVKMSPNVVLSSVLLIQLFITALLILSLFIKPTDWNYERFPSAVFPFAEPSHFAIFTAPLFLVAAFAVKRITAICLAIILLFASALLPNVTLGLIAVTVSSVVLLRGIRLDLFILGMALGSFALFYSIDAVVSLLPEYHRARVELSVDNLTSLVYLQGFERAYSAILITSGYGAGFMRLAEVPVGFYGLRIFEIIGSTKNIGDGAFVFAKLVAEFGVLGLGLSALFALHCTKAFLHIVQDSERFSKTNWFVNCTNEQVVFFYQFVSSVLILSYAFEFFVRGVGYISSGTLILLIGIFLKIWLRKLQTSLSPKNRNVSLTRSGPIQFAWSSKADIGRGSEIVSRSKGGWPK